MKCKECGKKQGRIYNSKSWIEFGCCRDCYRSNHRKVKTKFRQECKECGTIRNNYSTSICWNQNLCGLCYRKEQTPKRFRHNSLCGCGETLVSLMYQKRGVWVNCGGKVCTRCSSISLNRNKYRMAVLI
jgi:hypothetical protein